jgi:hypothetical protein
LRLEIRLGDANAGIRDDLERLAELLPRYVDLDGVTPRRCPDT